MRRTLTLLSTLASFFALQAHAQDAHDSKSFASGDVVVSLTRTTSAVSLNVASKGKQLSTRKVFDTQDGLISEQALRVVSQDVEHVIFVVTSSDGDYSYFDSFVFSDKDHSIHPLVSGDGYTVDTVARPLAFALSAIPDSPETGMVTVHAKHVNAACAVKIKALKRVQSAFSDATAKEAGKPVMNPQEDPLQPYRKAVEDATPAAFAVDFKKDAQPELSC